MITVLLATFNLQDFLQRCSDHFLWTAWAQKHRMIVFSPEQPKRSLCMMFSFQQQTFCVLTPTGRVTESPLEWEWNSTGCCSINQTWWCESLSHLDKLEQFVLCSFNPFYEQQQVNWFNGIHLVKVGMTEQFLTGITHTNVRREQQWAEGTWPLSFYLLLILILNDDVIRWIIFFFQSFGLFLYWCTKQCNRSDFCRSTRKGRWVKTQIGLLRDTSNMCAGPTSSAPGSSGRSWCFEADHWGDQMSDDGSTQSDIQPNRCFPAGGPASSAPSAQLSAHSAGGAEDFGSCLRAALGSVGIQMFVWGEQQWDSALLSWSQATLRNRVLRPRRCWPRPEVELVLEVWSRAHPGSALPRGRSEPRDCRTRRLKGGIH